MTFRPTLTAAEPTRRLEWVGRLVLPGLFDSRHEFAIEPLPDGGVRFVQRETFSGVLVEFLPDDEAAARDFEAMNAALAERAEACSHAETPANGGVHVDRSPVSMSTQ